MADIFMPANARLDDAHGWKHRKRSLTLFTGWTDKFGMLLGPEGTSSPPPSGGGFLCLLRRVQAPHSYQLLVGFAGPGVFGGFALWVCGLVGVCELDSGCEHLVVRCQTGQSSEFLPAGGCDVGC